MRVMYNLVDLTTLHQTVYPVDNILDAGLGSLGDRIYIIGGEKLGQPLCDVYILDKGRLIPAPPMQYPRFKPVCVSGYNTIYAIGSSYFRVPCTIELFDGTLWHPIPYTFPPAFKVTTAAVTATHLIIAGLVKRKCYACMVDTTTCVGESILTPPDFCGYSVLVSLNEEVYCINKGTLREHRVISLFHHHIKAWTPYNLYDVREDIVFPWCPGLDILG